MTLTLYNTLTRRKEPFEPLESGKVRMYCCGITVYDYCHLGHARTCIVWDTARRYLQWRGYDVHYVQNFTDIDDKILNRARLEGSSMEEVSDRFIKAYFEDMTRLNVKEADAYPRATHTLDGIKRLIYELEQKNFAYPAAGDVYYAVRQFPEYGKLSGRKLEDLQAGASGRVDVEDPEASIKKDLFDFALWKGAKPGEPAWESPWGAGRPGWHIECSAMIRDNLGETIDIHTGGSDLIFPHHENEIAQSEAVTGKPLARYWLHTGMVTLNGEKMSKSTGNFITIRQLLDPSAEPIAASEKMSESVRNFIQKLLERSVDPMAVRLFVLMAQYRKPIDFSDDAMEAATNGWNTLKEGLLFGYQYGTQLGWKLDNVGAKAFVPLQDAVVERFNEAVDDDFNFVGGVAVLFELAKDLQREGNILVHEGKTKTPPQELEKQWHTLVKLADVFGLEVQPEEAVKPADGLSDAEIEAMIQQRADARKRKDFAQGDRIRNELASKGITLIDKPGGVTLYHRN
jgi:cysteinyl-tRNA synthetase